ncbi:MAG: glycosyl hydrolase, partial [Gammaproteobacteria bacterium]
VVGPTAGVNLSDYSEGFLSFDIKVLNKGNDGLPNGFYIKVETTPSLNSGELPISGITADGSWESVNFPVSKLIESGVLQLNSITTPIVLFPSLQTGENLIYQIDNIRYTGIKDGATPPTGPNGGGSGGNTGDYNILTYGAGSVSTSINLNSYRCHFDYGNWIYNAGVVEPGVAGCDLPEGQKRNGTPQGTPTKLIPQVVEPAASKVLATHRWWGSIPFRGEMQLGDSVNGGAHIYADPIRTRVSTAGARIMGLPSCFQLRDGRDPNSYPQCHGGDPFSEVFDGIAIANSTHTSMDAYLKDYSDGSVTVLWKAGSTDVMEATFIHGSPYVYFKVY